MPMRSRCLVPLSFLPILLAASAPAHAADGGPSMPWDPALRAIFDNLQGTVAHTVVLICVVVTGLMWAFSEHSTGLRRLSQILFGAGIALGAASFLGALGIGGALV